MLKRNTTKRWTQILVVLDNWEVRDIGYIKDWVYYTKRNPDRHLFYKNNSYAFNYELLNQLPAETKIIVKETGKKLKTTVWAVMEHNSYKYFKWQGYELQLFYNRDKFGIELS